MATVVRRIVEGVTTASPGSLDQVLTPLLNPSPGSLPNGNHMTASEITSYLHDLDGPLREIGEEIRPVIGSALPAASGALWHGHPTWSRVDEVDPTLFTEWLRLAVALETT